MTKLIPFAALAAVLSACATPGEPVAEKLEMPPYEVLREDASFELRGYSPYVVATTVVEGSFDKASNAGFRILAGYIFGGNTPGQSIAMTAPVSAKPAVDEGEKIAMTAPVSAKKAGDSWRITFMMPSEYSLDTLPTPNDSRIAFQEQPEQCVATVRFGGFTTNANITKQTKALRGWLEGQGIDADGTTSIARYDDPFTLPWNRRNEVHLNLQGDACSQISKSGAA